MTLHCHTEPSLLTRHIFIKQSQQKSMIRVICTCAFPKIIYSGCLHNHRLHDAGASKGHALTHIPKRGMGYKSFTLQKLSKWNFMKYFKLSLFSRTLHPPLNAYTCVCVCVCVCVCAEGQEGRGGRESRGGGMYVFVYKHASNCICTRKDNFTWQSGLAVLSDDDSF